MEKSNHRLKINSLLPATHSVEMMRTKKPVGVLEGLRIVANELFKHEVPNGGDDWVLALPLPETPQEGAVEGEELVEAREDAPDAGHGHVELPDHRPHEHLHGQRIMRGRSSRATKSHSKKIVFSIFLILIDWTLNMNGSWGEDLLEWQNHWPVRRK